VDNKICFCFNHTARDLELDVTANNGRSLILEKIIQAKALGNCRCKVNHPEGR
jgi:hypothetical protein